MLSKNSIENLARNFSSIILLFIQNLTTRKIYSFRNNATYYFPTCFSILNYIILYIINKRMFYYLTASRISCVLHKICINKQMFTFKWIIFFSNLGKTKKTHTQSEFYIILVDWIIFFLYMVYIVYVYLYKIFIQIFFY